MHVLLYYIVTSKQILLSETTYQIYKAQLNKVK